MYLTNRDCGRVRLIFLARQAVTFGREELMGERMFLSNKDNWKREPFRLSAFHYLLGAGLAFWCLVGGFFLFPSAASGATPDQCLSAIAETYQDCKPEKAIYIAPIANIINNDPDAARESIDIIVNELNQSTSQELRNSVISWWVALMLVAIALTAGLMFLSDNYVFDFKFPRLYYYMKYFVVLLAISFGFCYSMLLLGSGYNDELNDLFSGYKKIVPEKLQLGAQCAGVSREAVMTFLGDMADFPLQCHDGMKGVPAKYIRDLSPFFTNWNQQTDTTLSAYKKVFAGTILPPARWYSLAFILSPHVSGVLASLLGIFLSFWSWRYLWVSNARTHLRVEKASASRAKAILIVCFAVVLGGVAWSLIRLLW